MLFKERNTKNKDKRRQSSLKKINTISIGELHEDLRTDDLIARKIKTEPEQKKEKNSVKSPIRRKSGSRSRSKSKSKKNKSKKVKEGPIIEESLFLKLRGYRQRKKAERLTSRDGMPESMEIDNITYC
jgi:hypothetical protein